MSEWSIFFRVMIPNALPGIISGGVLAFARGLGEFGATAMIAGNIPGRTRTLHLQYTLKLQREIWMQHISMYL